MLNTEVTLHNKTRVKAVDAGYQAGLQYAADTRRDELAISFAEVYATKGKRFDERQYDPFPRELALVELFIRGFNTGVAAAERNSRLRLRG